MMHIMRVIHFSALLALLFDPLYHLRLFSSTVKTVCKCLCVLYLIVCMIYGIRKLQK